MRFDIYNPYKNVAVTKDYIQIIEESLQNAGHETQIVTALSKTKENRKNGIVCVSTANARRAAKCGYGTVILWVQGAAEAESFMRNHSWLRYWVISARNWDAFRKTDFVLFCSETMKRYYEKKCATKFENFFIMPCFNDEIHEPSFRTENKYKNNVFTYAGSLAVWQCFEPTVALYREVEKRVNNCSFHVLTGEREEAEAILKKYGVERYSLDFVPREQVAEKMAKAKFGFCLREDDVVNRVATPTKFSSYIGNGVIPVYSEYVEDFHSIAKDCEYCVCANPWDLGEPVEKLVELCEIDCDPEAVYREFDKAFGKYYSREYHVEKLTARLKEFLHDQKRSSNYQKNNH